MLCKALRTGEMNPTLEIAVSTALALSSLMSGAIHNTFIWRWYRVRESIDMTLAVKELTFK